jgi:hypothetical protein
MDFAQEQILLLRREGKVKITTAMMNVLLSSAAERGDIDRVLSILQDFDRCGTPFNAETISFGFESLGKNLSRRRKFNHNFLDRDSPAVRDHVGACMVVANALLNQMDDHQIETTDHIIRNYVEFLCLAGYIETATTIVMEACSEKRLVSSKAIYRVAMANAKSFRFDVARQVATCDSNSEPLQFLLQSIDREESLYETSVKEDYAHNINGTDQVIATAPAADDNIYDDEPHYDKPQQVPDKIGSFQPPSTFWKPQTRDDT